MQTRIKSCKDLTLEFCAVEGFTEQGKLIPGETLATHSLQTGEVYLFGHLVPEGVPNLLVCARDGQNLLCLAPRFSGQDDSVLLEPGFVLFKKN